VDHATQRDEIIADNRYYEEHIKPLCSEEARQQARKRANDLRFRGSLEAQHKKKGLGSVDSDWPPGSKEIDSLVGG
jgi:hypothetical protein